MVILDVHDELGQRVEVKSAAPEPASVGKERSSGDACHGRCCIGNEGRQAAAAAAASRHRAAGEQQADSGANSWSGRGGAVTSLSCVKAAGGSDNQTGNKWK